MPLPEPFVIQEDIANGLRVELKDSDLPYGRNRELVAFETGGKYEIADDGIYNPGSQRVVLQMMQPKFRPLIIKGAFRDRLFGKQGHARDMRDQLERIRLRGNPVKISWAGDQRAGVLQETKFGEQSSTDIEYELTFFVAVPQDGLSDNDRNDKVQTQSSIANTAESLLIQVLAAMSTQLSVPLVGTFKSAINDMFTTLSTTIGNLADSATLLEKQTISTPQQAIQNVNRVLASAEASRQAADELQSTLDEASPDTVLIDPNNPSSKASWWSATFSTETTLDDIFDQLRTIKIQAQENIRSTTRLYRVQPGDTLESIATTQLGSRARASDLGIGPDALVVGTYVRIPEDK